MRADHSALIHVENGRHAVRNAVIQSTVLSRVPISRRHLAHVPHLVVMVTAGVQKLYTVNHKKRDIIFLTITLANLNRFL